MDKHIHRGASLLNKGVKKSQHNHSKIIYTPVSKDDCSVLIGNYTNSTHYLYIDKLKIRTSENISLPDGPEVLSISI